MVPSKGWYSRGYLPHCDFPGLLQSITYRLADSLPVSVMARIRAEIGTLPPDKRDEGLRRLREEFLDAGFGSCALRNRPAAQCVVETWRCFAPERYDLIAWVVMPNHVHILIRIREGWGIGKIVQSWKSFTGRFIMPHMGSEHSGPVWMREYWDRFIRDERHFDAVVKYIHENPVKARLVEKAEDWEWSSAYPENTEPPGSAEPQLGEY